MEMKGINYTGGDVIVFEQFGDFFESADRGGWTVQQRFSEMNMVVLLVCYHGAVQLRLNGRDYETISGQALALLPSAVIERLMVSPDVHIRGFGFAVTAMESMFHTYRQTWEEALSLNDHPQLSLTKGQMLVAEHLYQIAQLEQRMTDSRHYRPMMRSLVQSMLYMLADAISQPSTSLNSHEGEKKVLTKEQQFKRFVQVLWASGGKERKVAWFADQMCITPKYLSVIVRESCGKTPLQMIHGYTANKIAQLLSNTSLSIKEIAYELNFSNESFFGRYTKQHLGCSPCEYRNKMRQTRISTTFTHLRHCTARHQLTAYQLQCQL